jgi:hypothetical protein
LIFEWTLTITVDSVVIEEAKRNSYTRVSPPRFASGVTALGINVKWRKFHFENSPRKQKVSQGTRVKVRRLQR